MRLGTKQNPSSCFSSTGRLGVTRETDDDLLLRFHIFGQRVCERAILSLIQRPPCNSFLCMTDRLRRRPAATSNIHNNEDIQSEETIDHHARNGGMSLYGRRPVIAYQALRNNAASLRSSTANSYRNKILAVLTLTVLYTAFLYRSG